MSSFLRTIQRTTGKVQDKDLKWVTGSKRFHHNGRGTQLGTRNPKDPCLHPGNKKVRKPWRSPLHADQVAPKRKAPNLAQPCAPKATRADRLAAHKAAMGYQRDLHRGQGRQRIGTPMAGVSAAINRRTNAPHQHKREIARRSKRSL